MSGGSDFRDSRDDLGEEREAHATTGTADFCCKRITENTDSYCTHKKMVFRTDKGDYWQLMPVRITNSPVASPAVSESERRHETHERA